MAKLKIFNVTARIVVISTVEINADSYENAVLKARELTETDFITVDGQYDDGSIRIASISEDGFWETD